MRDDEFTVNLDLVRKLIQLAREEHVVELSVGPVKIVVPPASWILADKPAAPARGGEPPQKKKKSDALELDEAERRLGPAFTPREPKAGA